MTPLSGRKAVKRTQKLFSALVSITVVSLSVIWVAPERWRRNIRDKILPIVAVSPFCRLTLLPNIFENWQRISNKTTRMSARMQFVLVFPLVQTICNDSVPFVVHRTSVLSCLCNKKNCPNRTMIHKVLAWKHWCRYRETGCPINPCDAMSNSSNYMDMLYFRGQDYSRGNMSSSRGSFLCRHNVLKGFS